MKKRQLAKGSKQRNQSSRERPRLPRVSEETKRLASLLEAEVTQWPDVSAQPMFGMSGLYRKSAIFAALPRTRALGAPDAIGLRLANPSAKLLARMRDDERIVRNHTHGKWTLFLLRSDADFRGAVDWIELAYRDASK